MRNFLKVLYKRFIKKESSTLVFNFNNIFECYLLGKCNSDYVSRYVLNQISNGFKQEIDRRSK